MSCELRGCRFDRPSLVQVPRQQTYGCPRCLGHRQTSCNVRKRALRLATVLTSHLALVCPVSGNDGVGLGNRCGREADVSATCSHVCVWSRPVTRRCLRSACFRRLSRLCRASPVDASGGSCASARLRAPATRDANRLRLVGERSAKHAGEQDERVRERAGGRAVWRSTPPALVFVCTNGFADDFEECAGLVCKRGA
jgi:hypothetical protein